jgi:L-ribulose-5-phosphate 4-epimerase
MLETLKKVVCDLNLELPKNHLVTWTSGNVSALDKQSGYVVIKPSGIRYENMKPEQMEIGRAHV